MSIFDRFELKYVLGVEQASELRDEIREKLDFDPHGCGKPYLVKSLYFDSSDFLHYFEKLEGLRYRRKFRVRSYAETSPDKFFLEIKKKDNYYVRKTRLALDPDSFDLFWRSGGLPDCVQSREILHILKTYNMRPAVTTRYMRDAYINAAQYDLRVTFDTQLNVEPVRPYQEESRFHPIDVLGSLVIVEIKANKWLPRWIVDLIGKYGLRRTSYSKYCTAIAETKMAQLPK